MIRPRLRHIIQYIGIALLVSIPLLVSGQSSSIYSLRLQLQTASTKAEEAFLYTELAYEYRRTNPDSGIYFATKAQELAETLKDDKLKSDAYSRFGTCYKYKGELLKAEEYFLASLKIRRRLKGKKEIAGALNSLGAIYQESGRLEKALESYYESLGLYRLLEDEKGILRCKGNLANVRENQGEYEKAAELLYECLEKQLETEDKPGQQRTYTNLGNLAINNPDIHLKETAPSLFLKALTISGFLNDQAGQTKILNSLGFAYLQEGELDSAISCLNRSISLSDSLGFRIEKAKASVNLGEAYMNIGQDDRASGLMLTGLETAQKENDKRLELEALLLLSRLSEKKGKVEEALSYFKAYAKLKDEVLDESTAREIAKLDIKYRTAEREANKAKLEQDLAKKNFQIYSMVGIGFLLLVIILFTTVLLVNRQRLKYSKQQQEFLDLLKEHEIEITNAVLDGQEEERKRIGENLHDNVGAKLSTLKHQVEDMHMEEDKLSIDKKLDKIIDLLDETVSDVRTISSNMVSGVLARFGLVAALNDLAARIGEAARLKIEVLAFGYPENLDGKSELMLFRCIQEGLNNVLKHARATKVTIRLQAKEEFLLIKVIDNGIGFDPDKTTDGIGLVNIKSRVAFVSGTVDIQSKIGKGTTLVFQIPNTENDSQ